MKIYKEKKRESNIELYRIIIMLLIIAHHYVVNSGLLEIMYNNPTSLKSIFLFIFGAWGKIGINCFLLITGYYMCKSRISLKKFLKLLFEVEFYRMVIFFIFLLCGMECLEKVNIINAIWPFTYVEHNFTGCYLLFYLFIPYINKLIENMNKKEHEILILLMFFIYSVLGNISQFKVVFNYITLYVYIYLIGAYIRLYPIEFFYRKKTILGITFILIILCILSIIYCLYADTLNIYYYVSDSNKVLSVLTSICLFVCFKNMDIKYNKIINNVASSIFGVLLIHANSDAMRIFLWNTVLNNVEMFDSNYLYIHAISSVIIVFLICTLIDQIRIKFIETPFFEKIINPILKEKN